jgi:hypothetical protein
MCLASFICRQMEEEDGTFSDFLRLLPTQPAVNPSPKLGKQLKISLFKNFAASLLLLLHTFQKIQIESACILPNALAIALVTDIFF